MIQMFLDLHWGFYLNKSTISWKFLEVKSALNMSSLLNITAKQLIPLKDAGCFCPWPWCKVRAVPAPIGPHEMIGSHIASSEKGLNPKFKMWFPLNAYSFYIIVKFLKSQTIISQKLSVFCFSCFEMLLLQHITSVQQTWYLFFPTRTDPLKSGGCFITIVHFSFTNHIASDLEDSCGW